MISKSTRQHVCAFFKNLNFLDYNNFDFFIVGQKAMRQKNDVLSIFKKTYKIS